MRPFFLKNFRGPFFNFPTLKVCLIFLEFFSPKNFTQIILPPTATATATATATGISFAPLVLTTPLFFPSPRTRAPTVQLPKISPTVVLP